DPTLYQRIFEGTPTNSHESRHNVDIFENLDSCCSVDETPWTPKRRYTAVVMKKKIFATVLTLTLGAVVAIVETSGRQSPARAGGNLTIEQLIDIRHPSRPVWSPDGRHVAFLWERAGIANIFVADVAASSAPVGARALTRF